MSTALTAQFVSDSMANYFGDKSVFDGKTEAIQTTVTRMVKSKKVAQWVSVAASTIFELNPSDSEGDRKIRNGRLSAFRGQLGRAGKELKTDRKPSVKGKTDNGVTSYALEWKDWPVADEALEAVQAAWKAHIEEPLNPALATKFNKLHAAYIASLAQKAALLLGEHAAQITDESEDASLLTSEDEQIIEQAAAQQ